MTYEERVKSIAHEEAKDMSLASMLDFISETELNSNLKMELLKKHCDKNRLFI